MKVTSQISFFLFLIILQHALLADTLVWSGNINIADNFYIPAHTTLKLLPGTVVSTTGPYHIEVQGQVLAIGSEENPIIFTANDTIGLTDTAIIQGGWHGIHLINNDEGNAIFRYCTFEFGKANIPGSWSGWGGETNHDIGNMGGAVMVYEYGNVSFEYCNFVHNYARTSGGGIYVAHNQSIKISYCYFDRNKALVAGGAVYCGNHDSLFINNSEFRLNRAWGEFFDSIGANNYSRGSALYLTVWRRTTSSNFINNNRFFNNKSLTTVSVLASNSVVTNNIFTNNFCTATLSFNRVESSHTVFNNTLANNYYSNGIPGVTSISADFKLYNNILWNNLSDSVRDGDLAIQVIFISDIQYCLIWEGRAPGTHMITDDPLFVNPAPGYGLESNGWEYDWSLSDASPAVNAGTPDTSGLYLPATDITGNPRIYGNRIDMGAYENQHIWVGAIVSTDKNGSVTAYPNPARSLMFIDTPRDTEGLCTLYDMSGQLIRSCPVTPPSTTLSVAGLPPGLYLWKVVQGHTVSSGKVVVE